MGIVILIIFICCAVYVQNRGKISHEKFSRRLTDHANILAPINCLFYAFSKVKNTPYIDLQQFPELESLEENWQIIRDEALRLYDKAHIKASDDLDDLGFNSFFRTGWKRFYLKWYGADLLSAQQLCPQTLKLLAKLPQVKGAMFAMLPPGAKLVKHRDPYAGSLRYHLGLSTPNDDDCYLNVDGQRYAWRDGEAVMFDETFLHYAENSTEKTRIILFLDVKRPVTWFLINWLNVCLSYTLLAATATKNHAGDKVGLLNKVFVYAYSVRLLGKRIKRINKTLYYLLQYTMYLLLIYLIFFK